MRRTYYDTSNTKITAGRLSARKPPRKDFRDSLSKASSTPHAEPSETTTSARKPAEMNPKPTRMRAFTPKNGIKRGKESVSRSMLQLGMWAPTTTIAHIRDSDITAPIKVSSLSLLRKLRDLALRAFALEWKYSIQGIITDPMLAASR